MHLNLQTHAHVAQNRISDMQLLKRMWANALETLEHSDKMAQWRRDRRGRKPVPNKTTLIQQYCGAKVRTKHDVREVAKKKAVYVGEVSMLSTL